MKEEEQNARDALEKRIYLRIKDETEAMEVLNNKVTNFQERTEGIEELKEFKEIKKEKEQKKKMEKEMEKEKESKLMEEVREIQRKGKFEKLVDMKTPYVNRFFISDNNITLILIKCCWEWCWEGQGLLSCMPKSSVIVGG